MRCVHMCGCVRMCVYHQDVELESCRYYAIVNRNTAPNGVLVSSIPIPPLSAPFQSTIPQSVLYSHFELVLVDADWLIARLKTELDTTPSEDILGEGMRGASPFQVPFHFSL